VLVLKINDQSGMLSKNEKRFVILRYAQDDKLAAEAFARSWFDKLPMTSRQSMTSLFIVFKQLSEKSTASL
jgi:hypothetical protein